MNRKLSLLTLSALLALGAAGCSKGSSPTEPAFDLEDSAVAASSVSDSSDKRRGGDDNGTDDNGGASNSGRRGRGQDDPPGDDRGRRGRGGRGGNNNRPDDNPRPARAGQEFEAAVTAVNGQMLVLANGARVTVNGQTQWSNRGDLLNLSQVSGAVSANRPVRAEGRGTRQSDGTILATTLKVEVDD
ncbi:MAG TPA: hypothetical protein VF789_24965 [Thermoanaerobaculia bacterium]